jgi:hypothetical protein
MTELSKTQIDRLGDRLKNKSLAESDLRLLDVYKQSFYDAYEVVKQAIRQCGQQPTGRVKSKTSIVDKLRRESIRLSQIQDIAGCRVVVARIIEQDRFLATLMTRFPEAALIDRRFKPSHGYRAVHVIPTISGKAVEIQIRSALQQLWAELSEKASDVLDPAIKYGGGPEAWVEFLRGCSEMVATYEDMESFVFEISPYTEVMTAANEKLKIAATRLLSHQSIEQAAQEIFMKVELEAQEHERKHFEDQFGVARKNLEPLRNQLRDLFIEAHSRLDKLKESGR